MPLPTGVRLGLAMMSGRPVVGVPAWLDVDLFPQKLPGLRARRRMPTTQDRSVLLVRGLHDPYAVNCSVGRRRPLTVAPRCQNGGRAESDGMAACWLSHSPCASCGTGSAAPSSPAPPSATTVTGLRAAALAWSRAFLTGTVSDIRSLEGTACLTTGSATVEAEDLSGLRGVMQEHIGVPLDHIRVLGVQVRQATATSGQAEVEYDLPASVVGNDNWVTYQVQNGHWKETNCHAPIGGESQSASASIP